MHLYHLDFSVWRKEYRAASDQIRSWVLLVPGCGNPGESRMNDIEKIPNHSGLTQVQCDQIWRFLNYWQQIFLQK